MDDGNGVARVGNCAGRGLACCLARVGLGTVWLGAVGHACGRRLDQDDSVAPSR